MHGRMVYKMVVSDLIRLLSQFPQDADVQMVNYDGCSECNGDGSPNYHGVGEVVFEAQGAYPYYDMKNLVVLR